PSPPRCPTLYPYTPLCRSEARPLAVGCIARLAEAGPKQATEGGLATAMRQGAAAAARHVRRPDDVEAGFQRHIADDGLAILENRDRKSTRLNSSHVKISYA